MSADNLEKLESLRKENYDAYNEGRDISPAVFADWTAKVRALLDPRELRFFDEPFEPSVENVPQNKQAKTGARVDKILMDRRGYKVPKETGGLG